jgi:hypothetical protein
VWTSLTITHLGVRSCLGTLASLMVNAGEMEIGLWTLELSISRLRERLEVRGSKSSTGCSTATVYHGVMCVCVYHHMIMMVWLWSMVFPDCVGIRKAVRAVSRMLDGRAGGRRRGRPRYSYNASRAGVVGGTGYPTRAEG